MPLTLALFLLFLHLPLRSSTTTTTTTVNHIRRLLHHPFFPIAPSPLTTKFPFSSTTPSPPTTKNNTFFPSYPSPPPPPPPSPTALPTFPANISSLALPSSSSHSSPVSHSSVSHSPKLILTLILLSLLTLSLLSLLASLLHRRHHHHHSPPPKSPISATSHGGDAIDEDHEPPEIYLKLCGSGSHSPELNPLPPLPKHSFHSTSLDFHHDVDYDHQDQFFSPTRVLDGSHDSGSGSYSPARDSDISVEIQELLAEAAAAAPPPPPPPPPPPMGRLRVRSGSGSGSGLGPPALVPPSGPVVFRSSGNLGESGGGDEEVGVVEKLPKLKALHWDKLRASSERLMVWDQLKPGSFQLNEEMIETLFKVNSGKDGARRSIMPLLNEETRVLDPKKSQNVAILLKALNVTVEEVCEALLEGNADTLGTELLESLLKMAPTNEEERKLREYNDESPLKLGPAEKFLKEVLAVPFAFKRVDAMLYMATFDSEVEYLRKSFETLEAACHELKNSRMFLKLLEAVLKTGNRMNSGTNRGDAQAFKLDTLLKLVHIKGTDGKTTLLHFVVQEIIRAEGSHPSLMLPDAMHNDIESKKRGLEVVAGLGIDLADVKKAAGIDYNALSSDVAMLTRGILKVNEVVHLNNQVGMVETSTRFSESMNGFLKKAEVEIVRIQSKESSAFSRVKELTEYFHGDSAKEEAHPLRIFMVVRDFLDVLEHVCKEVGKINERTIIGSARPNSGSKPVLLPPFPEFSETETK